jgi:uncharacterized protein (DUF697 family)
MGLPLSLGAVYGVVKELSKTRDRPLLVAGKLASELARELAAGGDASAVRTGGSPEDVEALVYVVGDEVAAEDERVLKLAHRARVPTIVVAAGRTAPERIPFVLATDVVRAEPGHGFPVAAIAHVLAAKLGEDATSLARHLPVLRDAVCTQLIESFARKNGLVAAAVFIPGVDLPVLTLNQIRLVLRICAAYGLPVDNSRAPEILATVGAGLGFRAVARELLDFVPVAGWALKGTVAYLGTKALGEATVRYCEARIKPQPPAAASASSS